MTTVTSKRLILILVSHSCYFRGLANFPLLHMTIYDFIGNPRNLPTSLPTKRDIFRFINFRRIELKVSGRIPSNKDVFNDVATRLVEVYQNLGFQTASKRSITRSVLISFNCETQFKVNIYKYATKYKNMRIKLLIDIL